MSARRRGSLTRVAIVLVVAAFTLEPGIPDASGARKTASSYRVRLLRHLPFRIGFSPSGLNEHGAVSGTVYQLPRAVPFRWKNGSIKTLQGVPRSRYYTNAVATALNDLGHVAGSWDRVNGTFGGFLFVDGKYRILPRMTPVDAVNNHDRVAGSYVMPDGAGTAATWQNGKVTILSEPGPVLYRALDINDHGQAVGLGPPGASVLWEDGKEKFLGSIGCDGSPNGFAMRINERGRVAGVTSSPGGCGGWIPYLWTPGAGMRSLGAPCSYGDSSITGMNESTQIVGWCGEPGASIPWLWQDDSYYDPNDLIPENSGWIIDAAWDINDRGQMVVSAVHYPYGPDFPLGGALLLTPR